MQAGIDSNREHDQAEIRLMGLILTQADSIGIAVGIFDADLWIDLDDPTRNGVTYAMAAFAVQGLAYYLFKMFFQQGMDERARMASQERERRNRYRSMEFTFDRRRQDMEMRMQRMREEQQRKEEERQRREEERRRREAEERKKEAESKKKTNMMLLIGGGVVVLGLGAIVFVPIFNSGPPES